MAKEAVIVLPNQLFDNHPGLERGRPAILVEHPFFFRDTEGGLLFHKQKIILHRASMHRYLEELKGKGYEVSCLEYGESSPRLSLREYLMSEGIEVAFVCDPVHHRLRTWLEGEIGGGIGLRILSSPAFILDGKELEEYLPAGKRYMMASFYRKIRKNTGVLMEGGKPLGGKFSFDPENRKRLPADMRIPAPPPPSGDPYVKEARAYVERTFPDHPGRASGFIWPVTRGQARAWLADFLKNRLRYFGDYQDAMRSDEPFLFHSLLSSSLNIGLLTPDEVLQETLSWAGDNPVPLNSLEGFVRQILGWREFMRGIYEREGEAQRRSGFWGHRRGMTGSLYAGETGIPPLDAVIGRVYETAYAHHIERLMVLGSFMLLCEIDPAEVYRWFMELFIDAYDWVMVPNVFGMSQFADGGLITTKPYLNSSNYLKKMGDFERGPWMELWDSLYWRFLHLHRDYFAANPRSRVLTAHLDRMGKDRLNSMLKRAESFLESL